MTELVIDRDFLPAVADAKEAEALACLALREALLELDGEAQLAKWMAGQDGARAWLSSPECGENLRRIAVDLAPAAVEAWRRYAAAAERRDAITRRVVGPADAVLPVGHG